MKLSNVVVVGLLSGLVMLVAVGCGEDRRFKSKAGSLSLTGKDKILSYFFDQERADVFMLPVSEEANAVGALFRNASGLFSPDDPTFPIGSQSVKVCADKPIQSIRVLTCCNNPINQGVQVTSVSEHCKEVSPIEFNNPRYTLEVRLKGGVKLTYKPAELASRS